VLLLRVLGVALRVALVVAPAACGGARGCACGSSAAEVPDAPAPLRVAVDVDGKTAETIDAALLAGRAPDYQDGGRRAWKLGTLLSGAFDAGRMSVAIEDGAGVRHAVTAPGEEGAGRQVMVMVNPAGELRVALVEPGDPFRSFRGRGAGRGGSADPSRVRDIRRIVLTSAPPPMGSARAAASASARPEASGAPEEGEPPLLRVIVEGAAEARWSPADLDRVRALRYQPGDGDGARDAWSLRDLARDLLAGARIVELETEAARTVSISEGAWRDETRVPLLRRNRRGLYRFGWVTAGDLSSIEGADSLRDVRILRARRSP
jgi:hypothetical protein